MDGHAPEPTIESLQEEIQRLETELNMALEENVVLQRTLASMCLEIERLKNPGGGENDE